MNKKSFLSLLALLVSTLALLPGCATSATRSSASADQPSGAKLWAQNCIRCHNGRSPTEYSDAQWDIVMLHMRVRAGLAAKDAEAIRGFLHTAD